MAVNHKQFKFQSKTTHKPRQHECVHVRGCNCDRVNDNLQLQSTSSGANHDTGSPPIDQDRSSNIRLRTCNINTATFLLIKQEILVPSSNWSTPYQELIGLSCVSDVKKYSFRGRTRAQPLGENL